MTLFLSPGLNAFKSISRMELNSKLVEWIDSFYQEID